MLTLFTGQYPFTVHQMRNIFSLNGNLKTAFYTFTAHQCLKFLDIFLCFVFKTTLKLGFYNFFSFVNSTMICTYISSMSCYVINWHISWFAIVLHFILLNLSIKDITVKKLFLNLLNYDSLQTSFQKPFKVSRSVKI